MQQVEDQGDAVEVPGHPALKGPFAVGDHHPGAPVAGVVAGHLALTSAMKLSLSVVRLAQTRLAVGRTAASGRGRNLGLVKRLSSTFLAVRNRGRCEYTAATVAIFFLAAFWPFLA